MSRLQALKGYVDKYQVLPSLYGVFLCLFFVLETRAHRNFFYAFLILPFFLFTDRSTLRAVTGSVLWRLAVVYLLYLFVTTGWSLGATGLDYLNQGRRLLFVVFFITATAYLEIQYPALIRRLLRWLAWTAGVSGVAAIGYYFLSKGWPATRLEAFGRADHPIIGATLYGAVAVAILYYLIPNESRNQSKTAYYILLCVSLIVVVLTQSRGPMLALAVTLLGGALLTRRWSLALLLVVPPLAYALLGLAGIVEFGSLVNRGTSNRAELWQLTLLYIGEDFWFGQGSATQQLLTISTGHAVKSPHNLFLTNHLYGGIVATLLLGILLWRTAVAAYREWRRSGLLFYLGLLVFGLAAAMFNTRTLMINVNESWLVFWLPLALLAGREVAYEGKDQPRSARASYIAR